MSLTEKQLHILEVAEGLFANKGFEGTSVRDIAQAAEVNVAMISYYFGSKEKLLLQLIETRAERASEMLKTLGQDQSLTPWQKVDNIIDYYVDNIFEDINYHTISSRQLSLVNDPELLQLLVAIKRRNSSLIIDIIKEGKKKGVFRAVDNELTIGTVIGTIYQVSMSRLFYCDLLKIPPDDKEKYYRIIKPKLKKHLRDILHHHLSLESLS